MKYIMYEVQISDTTTRIPIIFPNCLVHIVMHERILPALTEHFNSPCVNLFSAGFINIGGSCYGSSDTLNLHSEVSDTEVINSYDYNHGIVF